jgi:tRNA threonylcarbamoyladenosine modification (KEOPS) complex Cgi121 subunit
MEDTKKYELRPLLASDMGAICKIITAIGIRQFKECFKVEDVKDGNAEQVGFSVVFDIAGIIISNIPKAEDEIMAFLSSVTGMKVAELKQMPFADYGELIIEVVTKDDFKDFFKRVMKLFNQ